jgi:hypothetical protein
MTKPFFAGAFGVDSPLVTDDPTGLTAETPVLTLAGLCPAADLVPGARVVTRERGAMRLAGLRVETVLCRPVRLDAGTLGHGKPDAPLVIGPGTLVRLTGWRAETLYGAPAVLVPAARLAGGDRLARDLPRRITLYTPVFETAQTIYAGNILLGMPAA